MTGGGPSLSPAGRRLLALGLSAVVLGLDRWTKHLVNLWYQARIAAEPHAAASVEVLGDAVRLTYVRNPGMVFGLFAHSDLPWRDTALTLASLVAIAVLGGYFLSVPTERRSLLLGLALVLGGAVGNIVDRLLYGYVIDFVDVSLHFARWPAFNVADSAIVVGVGLMAVDLLVSPVQEAGAERAGG